MTWYLQKRAVGLGLGVTLAAVVAGVVVQHLTLTERALVDTRPIVRAQLRPPSAAPQDGPKSGIADLLRPQEPRPIEHRASDPGRTTPATLVVEPAPAPGGVQSRSTVPGTRPLASTRRAPSPAAAARAGEELRQVDTSMPDSPVAAPQDAAPASPAAEPAAGGDRVTAFVAAPAAPEPAPQDAPEPGAEPAPAPRRVPPAPGGAPRSSEVAEETVEPLAGGTQLSVLTPGAARKDETITVAVVVENVRDLAHAPLRVVFDPEVLEFLGAREGTLLSGDGVATQFLASAPGAPGTVDIALSRLTSSKGGVAGSGTLCTLEFRALALGTTSIATSGSRLLDPSSRPLGYRRNDSHVAIE